MGDTVAIKFHAKDQFSRVSQKLNKALRRNRSEFRRLDKSMRESGETARKTGNKINRAFGKGGKAGKVASSVGRNVAGAGLFATGVALSKKTFTQGQELEAFVNRSLQNVKVEDRDRLRPILQRQIVDLAATSGRSREEVAAAQFDQLSTQGSGDASIRSLSENMKTAVGSTADFSAVVVGASKAIANFAELTTEDGGNRKFGITAFAAQQFGATTVEEIAQAFPQVAATLGDAGGAFSVSEIAAVLAAGSNQLGSASEAGTAISDVINTLTGAQPGDTAFQAAKILGLPTGLAEVQAADKRQLLIDISKSFQKNEIQANKLITTVPARQLLRSVAAGPKFLETFDAVQNQIATDVASPTGGALGQSFELETSGRTGQLNDLKALVDQFFDFTSAGASDAFENTAREVEFVKDMASAVSTGVTEALQALGQINQVKLDARGVANTPVGGVGDQTATD